jgi:hypothetical protein
MKDQANCGPHPMIGSSCLMESALASRENVHELEPTMVELTSLDARTGRLGLESAPERGTARSPAHVCFSTLE